MQFSMLPTKLHRLWPGSDKTMTDFGNLERGGYYLKLYIGLTAEIYNDTLACFQRNERATTTIEIEKRVVLSQEIFSVRDHE